MTVPPDPMDDETAPSSSAWPDNPWARLAPSNPAVTEGWIADRELALRETEEMGIDLSTIPVTIESLTAEIEAQREFLGLQAAEITRLCVERDTLRIALRKAETRGRY